MQGGRHGGEENRRQADRRGDGCDGRPGEQGEIRSVLPGFRSAAGKSGSLVCRTVSIHLLLRFRRRRRSEQGQGHTLRPGGGGQDAQREIPRRPGGGPRLHRGVPPQRPARPPFDRAGLRDGAGRRRLLAGGDEAHQRLFAQQFHRQAPRFLRRPHRKLPRRTSCARLPAGIFSQDLRGDRLLSQPEDRPRRHQAGKHPARPVRRSLRDGLGMRPARRFGSGAAQRHAQLPAAGVSPHAAGDAADRRLLPRYGAL